MKDLVVGSEINLIPDFANSQNQQKKIQIMTTTKEKR
jgi:hypothetical protein